MSSLLGTPDRILSSEGPVLPSWGCLTACLEIFLVVLTGGGVGTGMLWIEAKSAV